jgi:hypothetical protein
MQIATDKLHQLYEALHIEELKDHMEPYPPHVFLHSLRYKVKDIELLSLTIVSYFIAYFC